jgi:NAD(P)H-dependent FMN reductase
MEPLTLAVLIGTTRQQRQSAKVARYIAEVARQRANLEVILVDPQNFNFAGDGKDPEGKDPKYTEIVDKADAFFVVTPEYNHSFPGSLKRMLDSELELYNRKPIAFAGVSDGNWGGVRAVEALVPAVRESGLVVMSWDLYFPHVLQMFDEAEQLKPEYIERYNRNVNKLLDDLLWFAVTLKAGASAESKTEQ